ncbi:MAG: hypothetical protein KDC12_12915, partial [Flavobacteriales bacterium]|nr:hypothetical protein [Flavobacteriales bacterium]
MIFFFLVFGVLHVIAQNDQGVQHAHGSGLNLYFDGKVVESYNAFGREHLGQYGLPAVEQTAVPNWGRAVILNDLGYYGRAQEVLIVSDSSDCGILARCREARSIEMIRAMFGLHHYEEAIAIAQDGQKKAPTPLWRLQFRMAEL